MAYNRLFVDDEELGKKDDDFRPRTPNSSSNLHISPSSSLWPRMRRRRVFAIAATVLLVYLFIKNMPDPLTPTGMLVDSRDPGRTLRGYPVVQQVTDKITGSNGKTDSPARTMAGGSGGEEIPAILRGSEKTAEHYFEGPLKFYALPASLHGITHTNGYREENKNVLFVAANVQSASRLIPVACEMARYNRNHVHFVFLGRDAVEMDALKEVNGVTSECSVYWHDARPDDSNISTDARMEYSVTSALFHVQQYMHPQVYLMDESDEEEKYMVKATYAHAARAGKSVIELPVDSAEKMMWITRLDHASLAAWENVYIDILVHVPPSASGSLIRLLESIKAADYFGARAPHLTIELPPQVEPATQRYLDNFIWPPVGKQGGKHISQVTLRRRVSTSHLTPLGASVRTVESFYSARPRHSHVLVLSTQVELSHLYYHYLFYNVLEYGYSFYSQGLNERDALAGISLDLPSHKLDGTSTLQAPAATTTSSRSGNSSPETPFLWQAPDTHAALYFGDKWREFHLFLSKRLAAATSSTPSTKLVSPAFPAFAEPLLELMRARSWFMLYPHLPNDYAVATVHNELRSAPEEWDIPASPTSESTPPEPLSQNTLYLGPADPPSPLPEHHESQLTTTPLISVLPSDGDLPELSILPLLSWDALPVTLSLAVQQARDYASSFRKVVGRCPDNFSPKITHGSVDDLFCNTPEDEHMKSSDAELVYKPVRAGLEAAVKALGDDVPRAFSLEPLSQTGPATEREGNQPALAGEDQNHGLVLDDSLPSTKPKHDNEPGLDAKLDEVLSGSASKEKEKQMAHVAGGAIGASGGNALRKGPAKDGDSKQGTEEERQLYEQEQSKAAMQEEFRAHLDRMSKDPVGFQSDIAIKVKADEAKLKEAEEEKEKANTG